MLIIFSILDVHPVRVDGLSAFKPLDEIFMRPPILFPTRGPWTNYQTAFGTGTFFKSFFNSFYIATVVTVVSLLTCSMAAYAFARMSSRGTTPCSRCSWPR